MTMGKEKKKVFEVQCPDCHSVLWIDGISGKVIKSDKTKKKRGTLEDMLQKEKDRKSEFSHKFEATAEMQKEKRKKAEEKFRDAFDKSDSGEPS
jgi:hypothetical protein